MRRVLFGLVAVSLLAGAFARGGDAKKDEERIQGTWVVKSFRVGGEEKPPPVKDGKLTLSKGTWKQTGEGRTEEGMYKLDTTKKPKWIDVTEKGGASIPGIYTLEGDTLKFAMPRKGPKGPRPNSFDDKDASVVVLKRVKSRGGSPRAVLKKARGR